MSEDMRADDGAGVVTLGLGALVLMIVGAAAAVLADLRWSHVILAALLVPMSASTVLGLTVLGLAVLPLGVRSAASSDADEARASADAVVPVRTGAPAPRSLQRRAAQLELVRLRRQLEDVVGIDPQAPSLTGLVLELHEARLRLARIVLVEDGQLPPLMADELVVAHRGVAALLRSSACAPDRPDA